MASVATGSSLSEATLESYLERTRADWNNVGVAVAVVQGSGIVCARGFGAKELGQTACIDADTLFQIGSTTKAFTTAALGILVDERKVRWDDPVTDYLPEFQLQDPWLTRNLTIRDVVAHRSGISVTLYPFLSVMDSDQAIRQLRYVSPEARFRDSFLYNNLLYAVAGKVIEAASGMTWNRFIETRLLLPLRMNRSGTSPYDFWSARHVAPAIFGAAPAGCPRFNEARDGNVAMPHGWDENRSVVALPWQSYDNAAAAGSIVSSAADMAQWLVLHLNEGRFDDRQLLTRETARELHATQNLHAGANKFLFDEARESYAMGWWRTEYRGHAHLAHSGGIIGFPAYVALLPDRKMGVVVLSNGPKVANDEYTLEYLFHKAIALWVFDRLLGAPSRAWNQELLARFQSAQCDAQTREVELGRSRLADAPPSLALAQYAGVFEDRSTHSRLAVRVMNGTLMMSFTGEGAYAASLEPWHRDLFRLRSRAGVADALGVQFAAFAIDPAGQVTSMSALGATFSRVLV